MDEELKNQRKAQAHQPIDTTSGSRRVTLGLPRPPENEISESPFPYPRVYHWEPVQDDYGVKEPATYWIIITQEVLKRVNEHVQQDHSIEVGGFLYGNRYVCPNSNSGQFYIKIDNFSEAQFTSADDVSLHIDNLTWIQVQDELAGKYSGKKLMGWYHSHPGHTVFLSAMDINVHDISFTDEWMVALVIDPKLMTGGFFCRRRDGALPPQAMVDFYELKGINSEETYMPWENYQCSDGINNEIITPKLAAYNFGNASSGSPQLTRDNLEQEKSEAFKPERAQEAFYKKYPKATVLAAFLIFAVGAYWLFKPGNPDQGNNNAGNMNTGSVVSTSKTIETNANASTSDDIAAADKPASIKPVANNFICGKRKDFDCSLRVIFETSPANLIVTEGGHQLKATPYKDKAQDSLLIDIRDTPAVRAVKALPNPGEGTGDLVLVFTNPNDASDKTPYRVSFKGSELLKGSKQTPQPIVAINRQPVAKQKGSVKNPGAGKKVKDETSTEGKGTKKIEPCFGKNC